MTLRARSVVSAAFLVSLTAAAPRASAQTTTGFALDAFNPSERGSDWFAADSLDLRGHLRPAVGIVADYAYRPLVLYNPGGSVNDAVVRDELFAHFGASLNLWSRLRVAFDLPIALWQDGSSGVADGVTYPAATSSAGVGDVRLGADVRLLGKYGDPLTLAAGAQLFLPTGSQSSYLGDGSARVLPHVAAAGDIGWFAYAANLGFLFRPGDAGFGPYDRGSEVTFGASAGVRLFGRKLLVGPEAYGSTVVTQSSAFFSQAQTPVEATIGAHYSPTADWRVGLGAGRGLTQGLGEASLRVVASVEWAPAFHERAPAPVAVIAPLPPSDRDHDGIVDGDDACPDTSGVPSEDPKKNGCPLPPDRDGDTIVDRDDACPDVPGAGSTDPKRNGCPVDLDRDKDGVPNDVDACPDVPGPKSDDPKKSGCPLAFVEKGEIKIAQQVIFSTASAAIVPGHDSEDVLSAVLAVLNAHHEISGVRVEGHTDNAGSAALNKKLSRDRAAAVALWLEKHGIEKSRLTSAGLGSERPVDSNDTSEGRAHNRRVEFHIETSPSS
jgi:outer membrane protein OmpA-like peptidoglycan-associated protein